MILFGKSARSSLTYCLRAAGVCGRDDAGEHLHHVVVSLEVHISPVHLKRRSRRPGTRTLRLPAVLLGDQVDRQLGVVEEELLPILVTRAKRPLSMSLYSRNATAASSPLGFLAAADNSLMPTSWKRLLTELEDVVELLLSDGVVVVHHRRRADILNDVAAVAIRQVRSHDLRADMHEDAPLSLAMHLRGDGANGAVQLDLNGLHRLDDALCPRNPWCDALESEDGERNLSIFHGSL